MPMRKHIIIPAAALGCGIIGFFLRWWELHTAFEPDTGLPIPNAPATMALIALSAVAAAGLLALCAGQHSVFPGGYDQAFGAKGNVAHVAVMTLSAFLLLAAGGLTALELPAAYEKEAARLAANHAAGSPLLPVVPMALLALLCLLSCPCVLLTGRNNYRGEGRGKYAIFLLAPAFALCAWLITAYQRRAADPVQLDYVYELFAIITALMGFYYAAGFAFERAKVTRAAWTSALGVYFSLVTLADGHSLAQTLLHAACLLALAANLAALLVNDLVYRDARPPETETPAEGAPEAERMPEEYDGPLPTQTEIEQEFRAAPDEIEREDDTNE